MTVYPMGSDWWRYNRHSWGNTALAAATGTAKTAQQAECEASQSGPKGNAHTPSPKGHAHNG